MNALCRLVVNLTTVMLVGTGYAGAAGVADLGSIAIEPKFKPPAVEEVRQKALDWLSQRSSDNAVRQSAEAIWQAETPFDLVDRLVKTFGLSDERAASLVAQCTKPRAAGPLPPQEWLKSDSTTNHLLSSTGWVLAMLSMLHRFCSIRPLSTIGCWIRRKA
jgi:hypothetical protein